MCVILVQYLINKQQQHTKLQTIIYQFTAIENPFGQEFT